MIEFFTGNWGSLASALGLLVTIAIAWSARAASRSAEKATVETRGYIERHLQTIDLERAVGLIQRIKLLHDTGRWQAAMEQYQALRMLLSDIIARCPEDRTEILPDLATARILVRSMENFVGERVNREIQDSERSELNRQLNEIQSGLEELASATGLGN